MKKLKWVSVNNRLPMEPINKGTFENMPVLVTDGVSVYIGNFQRGNCSPKPWVAWSQYDELPRDKITHWMPLPEPPK